MLTILLVDDPEYCSALSDSEKRFPTVFFKVVKLDGPPSNFPSFICDHRSTRVVQVIKLPFWSMLIKLINDKYTNTVYTSTSVLKCDLMSSKTLQP